MATARTSTFMNETLNFLASTPTPQDIVAYRPPDALKARSHHLHERNRKDALTDAERMEFDELRRMNHFMNQLKIRARLRLEASDDE